MKKQLFVILMICLISVLASAFDLYPQIKELNRQDPVFQQFNSDLRQSYRESKNKNTQDLQPVFYYYQTQEDQDFFLLASKLGLPYESLVTINHLQSNSKIKSGTKLIISGSLGLFLPREPQNQLQAFCLSLRDPQKAQKIKLKTNTGLQEYYFFPQERFLPSERLFFLGHFFFAPIQKMSISSAYGDRSDPFTGKQAFHRGIDIRAAVGTPVFASKSGKVLQCGTDPVFGQYILCSHPGNYQTFYGHLQKTMVKPGDRINAGMMIGESGNSGRSTGPHLHFELRRDSRPLDPLSLIRRHNNQSEKTP